MPPPFKLDFSTLLSSQQAHKKCPYTQCLSKIIESLLLKVKQKFASFLIRNPLDFQHPFNSYKRLNERLKEFPQKINNNDVG